MVAVKLTEPQEVVVVDLEAVPLSANAEDVSDVLLGLLTGLGEQHCINAQLILDCSLAPDKSSVTGKIE